MSYRTTVVLLLVLGALAAYLLWIEPRTRRGPQSQQASVYTVDPAQVTAVEVQSGEARVRLERVVGGPWRFADGRQEPVDQARLSGRSLGGPIIRRTLADVSDLGQFGLAPPQATFRLSLQDGSEVMLQLGNRSPDAAMRYVQKDEPTTVYLVDDFWAQAWLRVVSEPPVEPTPAPIPSPPPAEATPVP